MNWRLAGLRVFIVVGIVGWVGRIGDINGALKIYTLYVIVYVHEGKTNSM